MLNIKSIEQQLNIDVIYLEEVTSTNEIARNYLGNKDVLIIAEIQTAGRGTNNRQFSSPKGGLYISYVSKNREPNITFKVSSSIYKAIDNNDVKIKWINDLYYLNKKLCGILVEKVEEYYIIGFGINICENDDFSYLKQIDNNIDVTSLVIDIIENINNNYDYMDIYRENCMTIGKTVKYKNEEYIVDTVNDDGSLKLKNRNNIIDVYDRNLIMFIEENM